MLLSVADVLFSVRSLMSADFSDILQVVDHCVGIGPYDEVVAAVDDASASVAPADPTDDSGIGDILQRVSAAGALVNETYIQRGTKLLCYARSRRKIKQLEQGSTIAEHTAAEIERICLFH